MYWDTRVNWFTATLSWMCPQRKCMSTWNPQCFQMGSLALPTVVELLVNDKDIRTKALDFSCTDTHTRNSRAVFLALFGNNVRQISRSVLQYICWQTLQTNDDYCNTEIAVHKRIASHSSYANFHWCNGLRWHYREKWQHYAYLEEACWIV